MALPVGSGYSIEEVAAAATGPIWFQHIHYSDSVSENFLPRLKPAGYSAVVLTVDALGPFELDKRLPGPSGKIEGRMFGSLEGHEELLDDHGMARWIPPNITWDRLDWVRSLSGGLPLVIKGIRNAEDARLCVEHGVDGIIVSNHGGRQFDGGRSSIEVLPDVVDTVGDSVEVYFDSGVRSGLDVFRALVLGARAVFVGRVVHWGLAYGGEAGGTARARYPPGRARQGTRVQWLPGNRRGRPRVRPDRLTSSLCHVGGWTGLTHGDPTDAIPAWNCMCGNSVIAKKRPFRGFQFREYIW